MAKTPNFWVDNKMPVLEHCSVDRVSQLFNCSPDEILSLGRSGAISLYQNLNGIRGKARIVMDKDREDEARTLLTARIGLGARFGFLPVEFIRVGDKIEYEHKHVLFINLNVEAYGFWTMTYYHPLNPYGLSSIFREVSQKDGVRLMHLRLPDRQVETKDVFIMRGDIERLHASSLSGRPLAPLEQEPHLDLEVEDAPKERITVKQSDYIAALMNALGISEIEMRDGSINQIKHKLSSKAKQLPIPEVTEDTLTDWLKRAGKR
ncbi:hypothetical protein LZU96_00865 [Pantoea agglomerans]|uniref:hypothetical protein n=1 Tax=Enterobacter agglomerans TaxID=549 RepID=UPI001F24FBC1|nr:hypothetical protein [Pantoea agglomerans]UIL52552.1 hypothetical protein LZU96_00865 [Pantoea agglomerans]